MDCNKALQGQACYTTFSLPATYSTTTLDGRFMAVGSSFSYLTGEYDFCCMTIDPDQVMSTNGSSGISQTLPGTMKSDIEAMGQPYGLYVNPYTGYMYGTDATSFENAGYLYQWSPQGALLGKHKVYINPGHFLALPPDGHFTGISRPTANTMTAPTAAYDLQGRRVSPETLREGSIYVRSGKKYVR